MQGRGVRIVFEGEDQQELEDLLRHAGATGVEEVTESGLLPVDGTALAAVVEPGGLANVVMKLSRLWSCGLVVDVRGATVEVEKSCDLPRGTVVVPAAEGSERRLHEPSEQEVAALLQPGA